MAVLSFLVGRETEMVTLLRSEVLGMMLEVSGPAIGWPRKSWRVHLCGKEGYFRAGEWLRKVWGLSESRRRRKNSL